LANMLTRLLLLVSEVRVSRTGVVFAEPGEEPGCSVEVLLSVLFTPQPLQLTTQESNAIAHAISRSPIFQRHLKFTHASGPICTFSDTAIVPSPGSASKT
jgi:hypothetical protein